MPDFHDAYLSNYCGVRLYTPHKRSFFYTYFMNSNEYHNTTKTFNRVNQIRLSDTDPVEKQIGVAFVVAHKIQLKQVFYLFYST